MIPIRMTEAQARKAKIPGTTKRRKYGNKPCEMDGFKFDSQAELKRYSELKLLERAGAIKYLIADKSRLRFTLKVSEETICVYEADFDYWTVCGERLVRHVVEDTKGVRTAVYIIKKKLMLAIYGIEIQEIG